MSKRFVIEGCSIGEANSAVALWHRHCGPIPIAKENLRLRRRSDGADAGVGILGLPLAQAFNDGLTLEVRRVATDGTEHACSAMLGALCRAAARHGALRVLTYTREEESGASLRAAGFRLDRSAHQTIRLSADCRSWDRVIVPLRPRSWNMPRRPRIEPADAGSGRLRWWRLLPAAYGDDNALRLGARAALSGATKETNPFCANEEWQPWALWREGYDTPTETLAALDAA